MFKALYFFLLVLVGDRGSSTLLRADCVDVFLDEVFVRGRWDWVQFFRVWVAVLVSFLEGVLEELLDFEGIVAEAP